MTYTEKYSLKLTQTSRIRYSKKQMFGYVDTPDKENLVPSTGEKMQYSRNITKL